jgi:hypothetical protein
MLEITIQFFVACIMLTLIIHVPIFLWLQFQEEKSKRQGPPKKNPIREVSYFEVLKASTNVLDAYGDFTEATEGLLKKLQQTPPGTADREFLVGVLNKLITTYSMIEKDKLSIVTQLKQINDEVDNSYETSLVGNPSGRQVTLAQPCI